MSIRNVVNLVFYVWFGIENGLVEMLFGNEVPSNKYEENDTWQCLKGIKKNPVYRISSDYTKFFCSY